MYPRLDWAETLTKSTTQIGRYASGSLESCVPLEPLRFRFGDHLLVAQSKEEPPRRSVVPAIEFYENGQIKDVTLQTQTLVSTSLGPLPAERVTFYSNGSLRRLFPSAGKPNATWSEDDEATQSPKIRLNLPTGDLESRLIGVCFFQSGKVRSVTLWPKETVTLATPAGEFPARIGIAFHESGALRAFEPARALELPTPIGPLLAFHSFAVGIHGDRGSVEFTKDGKVKSLVTEAGLITVKDRTGSIVFTHSPQEILSRCEDSATEVLPMRLTFDETNFTIDGRTYPYRQYNVEIVHSTSGKRKLPMFCGC